MNPPSSVVAVLYRRIRLLLLFFVIALVLSGLTAIPLETELNWVAQLLPSTHGATRSALGGWILRVREGLVQTNAHYPFVAYGTDWLAFAHLVIAVAFIGPYRNPVRNIWVIEFGIIACLMVIIFPFIMGPFRGIPIYWRLLDSSFGVFGIIPLWLCRKYTRQLPESMPPENF